MQVKAHHRIPFAISLMTLLGFIIAVPGLGVRAVPPKNAFISMSVIISEVAWGGTAASTADEWIELYNPGLTDIDLTSWILAADDGTPTIALADTIPAGGFYLLERNTDNVVSNITADQVYAAESLNDNGEFLHLKAPDNTDIDTANMTGGAWLAGTGAPAYASMERVDLNPDGTGAWVDNDGITINGLDANGNPLRGTPGQANSAIPTPTPSLTATFTTTSTPTAPTHVVISEFRSRGPNGVDDEFVELYNPTGASVNIGGWMVKKSASCGSINPPAPTPASLTLFTVLSGTILTPGQHYLAISSSHSSISGGDQTFTPALADDGGLALINTGSAIIDQAGMCPLTQYREGTILAPLVGTSNQSYERRPGGSTACYDTDNNTVDFQLIPSSNPQNKSSPITLCLGVITLTPTVSQTPTHTRTPTPYVYKGVMAINEFLPRPGTDWNSDGTANGGDEYIEIINMGVASINLKNWKLDNGGYKNSFTLPDLTLLPRQIVHFFASDTGIILSDGGGSVRLLKSNGETADSFNYPVVVVADQTWCRLPDGNGIWSFDCHPTPGKPNGRITTRGGTPSASPPESEANPCPQLGVTSEPIWVAECSSQGGGMLGIYRVFRIWLPVESKWDVFLE